MATQKALTRPIVIKICLTRLSFQQRIKVRAKIDNGISSFDCDATSAPAINTRAFVMSGVTKEKHIITQPKHKLWVLKTYVVNTQMYSSFGHCNIIEPRHEISNNVVCATSKA